VHCRAPPQEILASFHRAADKPLPFLRVRADLMEWIEDAERISMPMGEKDCPTPDC